MIYPTECAKITRRNTLSVDAKLARAKSQEGQNPLELYDSRWSRFIFAIIETGKTSVTANIPVRDIPSIIDKSHIALQMHMAQPVQTNTTQASDTTGLAYTQRLSMGKFAGKTPMEVLDEAPKNADALKSQYDFLSKNLGKYPKNKLQMDAISQALEISKSGVPAKAPTDAPAKSVVLYDVPMKSLMSRKRKVDGRCFVYSMRITWETGEQYPVVIRIENYYAFTSKDKNGIRIDVSSKVESRSQTFRCTDAEWSYIISRIEKTMDAFEGVNAGRCFADSAECERASRAAAPQVSPPPAPSEPWNIFDS